MTSYIDPTRAFIQTSIQNGVLAQLVDCYSIKKSKFTIHFKAGVQFEVKMGRQVANGSVDAAEIILGTFAYQSFVDLNGKKCSMLYDGPQYGFFYGQVFCINPERRMVNQPNPEGFLYPINHYSLKMNPCRDGFSFSISEEYQNQEDVIIENIKEIFNRLKINPRLDPP